MAVKSQTIVITEGHIRDAGYRAHSRRAAKAIELAAREGGVKVRARRLSINSSRTSKPLRDWMRRVDRREPVGTLTIRVGARRSIIKGLTQPATNNQMALW